MDQRGLNIKIKVLKIDLKRLKKGVFGPKMPFYWRTWEYLPSPAVQTIFLANKFWRIWGALLPHLQTKSAKQYLKGSPSPIIVLNNALDSIVLPLDKLF